LGSSYTSGYRALILWVSVGCSVWINHYFLYDEKLLENIREHRIVTEQYTANDVAKAAGLSSMGGVLLAMILRQIIVLLSGGSKWERLDDKDDLSHLMKPGVLEYAQGAVVRRTAFHPTSEYVSLTDLQYLTQEQRRAIKHITECKISDCSLKRIINDPFCAPHKDCCYSRDNGGPTSYYTPTSASVQESFQQPHQTAAGTAQEEIVQPRISVPLEKKKQTAGKTADVPKTARSPRFNELCDCEPRLVQSDNITSHMQFHDAKECCADRQVESCTAFCNPSCGNPKCNNEYVSKKSHMQKASREDKPKISKTKPNRDERSANVYNTPYTSMQTSLTSKKLKSRKNISSKNEGIAPQVSAQVSLKNGKQAIRSKVINAKSGNAVLNQIPSVSKNKITKSTRQSHDEGLKIDLEDKNKTRIFQGFNETPKYDNKKSKRSKSKCGVPQVSARTESIGSDIFFDALTGKEPNENNNYPVGDLYDSVSEPESEHEIVTKSARTDSEINLVKRPANVYNTAPQWHDKYHVWIEAANGGLQHHMRLNRRYDFAVGGPDISSSNQLSKLERAIHNYLLEEQNIQAGEVNLPNTFLATLLVGMLALGALFLLGHVVYQRLFISNGDTVIFLYALVFSLLLNIILFSTVAAGFSAILAAYRRRKKILLRREQSTRRY